MMRAHTHPDIELNFLQGEGFADRHGGVLHSVERGSLVVFWAGIPHQAVHLPEPRRGIWVYLPLPWLLQWKLPKDLAGRLLAGERCSAPTDLKMIADWPDKFASGDKDMLLLLQLELRTLLTRLAISMDSPDSTRRAAPPAAMDGGDRYIANVTSYLSLNYAAELSIEDVAQHIGLKSPYLKQVFHRQCGISIWEYLTRLRISHAQRLLSTTDRRVLDIALDCGFGSATRFYTAFSRYCHCSPLDFRRRQQKHSL